MGRDEDRVRAPEALRDLPRVFHDRAHAGRFLARLIADEVELDTVVCALAPGGVVVGARVARYHRLPLEPAITTDICAPWPEGPAFGAVAWDGSVELDQPLLADLELSREELRAAIDGAFVELARSAAALRGDRAPPVVCERGVVLVSDGCASTHALRVAIAALRNGGAARIVLALPAASRRDLQRLAPAVDRAYCASVHVRSAFRPEQAYVQLEEVAVARVADLLAGHAATGGGASAEAAAGGAAMDELASEPVAALSD